VDTSVIIAAIDKGDQRCKDSDKFLRRKREDGGSPWRSKSSPLAVKHLHI